MENKPARLICLRHAEAERTTTPLVGLADPSLTARGRDQAATAAKRLRREQAGMVYASSAVRSRQTAAIIAERLGLSIVVLPALAEVAVAAQVLEAWIVHGDLGARAIDGESGHAVASRVTAALAEIAAEPHHRHQRSLRQWAVVMGSPAAACHALSPHPQGRALARAMANPRASNLTFQCISVIFAGELPVSRWRASLSVGWRRASIPRSG
jgi:broad specificity phosphatase PhoE